MSLIKIIIYSTSTGKEPFTDWQNALDKSIKSIVRTRLDRVELGNFGDCKQVKNGRGLWELRLDCGPGYRIYFAKNGPKIVILLAAGDKKSQDKDIAKAKQYWLEYKELYE
jgi:putative addiction module killer protein